jgi:hypothetical protein
MDALPLRTRIAILAVKSVHSAIFLGVAVCIVQVCYAGVTGHPSRWTKVALVAAVGERVIFVGWGFRCPLQLVAEDPGAESGQVTDIFLPRWFADRIP